MRSEWTKILHVDSRRGGEKMIKVYCDRCKKEITGTMYGKGTVKLSVNDSNHESWPGEIKFVYCYNCTKIVEKSLRDTQ